MSTPPEPPSSRARAAAIATLLAVLVAPALLVWSWSRPTPAPPTEMPPLALPPDAVRAQIAADEAAAARAPADDEVSRARLEVFEEANVAEIEAADAPGVAARRRARLEETLADLVEAHGPEAVEATRARDLDRAERAMRGELPGVQRAPSLGAFPAVLERWSMARRGRQVAPRFVVRTAFKARWNAMYGREPTEGLGELERRAHWGWLALHGDAAPFDMRAEAIGRFRELGGERAEEARAVLLYDEQMGDEAREAFEAAYAERPTFRLRNHALAAAAR